MLEAIDDLIAVLEDLPVGMFALDGAGAVVLWNATATEITGLHAKNVLGCNGFDTTSESVDLDAMTAVVAELRAGRSYHGPLPAVVPSGRSVQVSVAPVPPGPDGTAPLGVGVVGMLRDVTDLRAHDESLTLLDALWESAPVGLVYFDADLRYRRVNAAVVDVHGGSAEDRIGRTLEEVHGEVGRQIAEGMREVLAEGVPRKAASISGRLWHGTGREQTWSLNQYPVRDADGAVVGVGAVVADVTEAEQARRDLADLAARRQRLLHRYQSLIEATSAAVWIRSADGRAQQDSPSMRAITGQSAAEHGGWGYLDAVHPEDRAGLQDAWGRAIATGRAFSHTNRLRTAAGHYRWFRVRAVPVRRADGRVAEWVGTEHDIDAEVLARHRLDVLAGATVAVNAALDPEAELTALADAVVPSFADLCRVYLVDAAGPGDGVVTGLRSVTRTAPTLPGAPPAPDRFVFAAGHPISRSVRTGTAVLEPGPLPPREEWSGTVEMWDWCRRTGMNSTLAAPVVSGGEVVAALMFFSCGDRPPFTEEDRALVVELATRASAAVEHALRFQRARQVSLALQNAMLTEPPPPAELGISGLAVQARYLPAAAELQVGGDWYDAFRLPGGDLALAVGDVAGHDLPAAAAMGQLRSMLRALAYDTDGEPSDVLRRLDRTATRLEVTRFTTLVYGRVVRADGRTWFRWSNAGHPSPVLIGADGDPRLLDGQVDVVLGVEPDLARHDHQVELPPGSTLLLYTDGLYEQRDDPDDLANEVFLKLVADAAALPLNRFCDGLVRGTTADTGDDIVVLALRLDE